MRLLACLALLLGLVLSSPVSEAQTRPTARYEYARLAIYTVGETQRANWRYSGGEEEGSTLYDLFRIMGGESERPNFILLDFYNLVGADGWLLADVENIGYLETYTFSRPKR